MTIPSLHEPSRSPQWLAGKKKKDEGDAEPGCESTSRQEVLLEAACHEHLNPPLAPETQTGALWAFRNYLPSNNVLSQGLPCPLSAEKLRLMGDHPWSLLAKHGGVVTAFPPAQFESRSAEAENGQWEMAWCSRPCHLSTIFPLYCHLSHFLVSPNLLFLFPQFLLVCEFESALLKRINPRTALFQLSELLLWNRNKKFQKSTFLLLYNVRQSWSETDLTHWKAEPTHS